MKRVTTLIVLTAASLVATTALAQEKAPAAAPTVSAIADALGVREKMTATAIVQEVDQNNRLLTLKAEDGQVFTIKVGDEVRNLAQVRAGDTVKTTYNQAVALQLEMVRGTGVNERVVTVNTKRAPLGEMPAGVVERKVEIIGTILAVNKEKRTVLVEGPKHQVTLQIPPDMDVQDLAAGDQVRVTYTQELAVVVDPTGGRAASSWWTNKVSNKAK